MFGSELKDLVIGLVLWVLVYVGDYYLTLYGSQLWKQHGKAHIEFDGSYELNPYFQNDINANVTFSPRFILMLVVTSVWLVLAWLLSGMVELPQVFQVGLGFLLLMEVVLIEVHVQNITLFSAMKTDGAYEGHLRQTRWTSMTSISRRFTYWTVAYFVLYLLTGSWLLLGGALSCLVLFIRYEARAIRLRRQTPSLAQPQTVSADPAVPSSTVG